MACERNRIIELKKYLLSKGIDVNIGKNKARGHNGIFVHGRNRFRIDISKNIDSENSILSILLHEYAHFIHFSYDSKLESLDFVFGELSNEIKEELIKVTVDEIPKEFAQSLYSKKQEISAEIKKLNNEIKKKHPDFRLSKSYSLFEKKLPNPFRYLLKYDRVKYFDKIYSLKDAENNDNILPEQLDYLKIKSLQRISKRINSKINRLNNYYNNPSELFARFISAVYTTPERVKKLAPISYKRLCEANLPQLAKINKIFCSSEQA